MEFNRAKLVSALGAVFAVAPTKSPKEILRCALMSLNGGRACFVGTDLEVTVSVGLSLEAIVYGSVLFTPESFALLKGLSEQFVEIHPVDDGFEVRTSSGKWKFLTPEPSGFPASVESVESPTSVSVSGDLLLRAIGHVAVHTDTESTRYALGGICFDPVNMSLVATNGKSLAVHGLPIEHLHDTPIVVPLKAAKVLCRELTSSQDVTIRANKNRVSFETEELTVVSRLVEGRFPQWRSVVPSELPFEAEVHAPAFKHGLHLIGLTANDETSGAFLDFSNESIGLSSARSEIGSSEMTIPASRSTFTESVRVSVGRELAALCLQGDGLVTISLKSPNEAVLFRRSEDVFSVLMPLST